MKYQIRTKQGEFRDDINHFTTKWQDVDESRVRGEYLDNDNLEVKEPKATAAAPVEEE